MYHLSEGALQRLINGEELEEPLYFQVLSVKNLTKFSKTEMSDRYRLNLSDGQTTYSFVTLFKTLNKWIHTKVLTDYCIIKVNQYTTRGIKYSGEERVIMIIINLEVIVPGYQINRILGNVDVSFIEEKMELINLS